jgi:hypothetical protein
MSYHYAIAGSSPVVSPLPHKRPSSSFRLPPALSRAELQRIIAEMLG